MPIVEHYYQPGHESALAFYEREIALAETTFREFRAIQSGSIHFPSEQLRTGAVRSVGQIETIRAEAELDPVSLKDVCAATQDKTYHPRVVGLVAMDRPYRDGETYRMESVYLWYDSDHPRPIQPKEEAVEADPAAFALRGDRVVQLNRREAENAEARMLFALRDENAAARARLNVEHLLVDTRSAEVHVQAVAVAAYEKEAQQVPRVFVQTLNLHEIADATPPIDDRFMVVAWDESAEVTARQWNTHNQVAAVERAIVEQLTGIQWTGEEGFLERGTRYDRMTVEDVPYALRDQTVMIDGQKYTYHVLTSKEGGIVVKLSTIDAAQRERIRSISIGGPVQRGDVRDYQLQTYTVGSGTQEELVHVALGELHMDQERWNRLWVPRPRQVEQSSGAESTRQQSGKSDDGYIAGRNSQMLGY